MKIPEEILNCEGKCLFRHGGRWSTHIAYVPIYDKEGVVVNSDPNERTGDMFCQVKGCGRSFLYHTYSDGNIEWRET